MSELKEIIEELSLQHTELSEEYLETEMAQYKREGMVLATGKILGWLKDKYEDSITTGNEGEEKVEEGTEDGGTTGED